MQRKLVVSRLGDRLGAHRVSTRLWREWGAAVVARPAHRSLHSPECTHQPSRQKERALSLRCRTSLTPPPQAPFLSPQGTIVQVQLFPAPSQGIQISAPGWHLHRDSWAGRVRARGHLRPQSPVSSFGWRQARARDSRQGLGIKQLWNLGLRPWCHSEWPK